MEINKINLKEKLDTFNDHWHPRIVGELNNQMVKIAKVKGAFEMHKHDKEDELFYVIDGTLFIEMEDQTVELNRGEFVIIPKGVDHKPYAPEEASIMLFEPATTLNTGNKINEKTKKELDRI